MILVVSLLVPYCTIDNVIIIQQIAKNKSLERNERILNMVGPSYVEFITHGLNSDSTYLIPLTLLYILIT